MRTIIKGLGVWLCLLIINVNSAKAQNDQSNNISSISLVVAMPALIDGLTDASVLQLKNKLSYIVTNQGLASNDETSEFILSPSFQVSKVQTTSGTMQKIMIADCILTIFIKQASTKTVFATYTKTIQGTEATKEEAIAAAVSGLSAEDVGIARFIEGGKAKIIAWYQQNCQQFIAKADKEVALRNFDAAQKILSSIPQEAEECYATAITKSGDIFEKQYGSLEKTAAFFQKQATIDPQNETFKKVLSKIKNIITFKSQKDKTPPVIELIEPKVTRGQTVEADVVKDRGISVRGAAKDPAGIATVNVNGKVLTEVNPDGFFQTYIGKDETNVVVQATDRRGNSTTSTFAIGNKVEVKPDALEIKPLSDNENFYALFIGNANYSGQKWASLKTVIDEEKSIIKILSEKYNFKPANIDTVFNKNRKSILTAISTMLSKMTDNDNLVLFYGGHGYFVESTNIAYWVPIGAENEFEYISNSDITNLLAGCQARHILVMADACFSGAMRSAQDAPGKYEYKFKSRQLLTSGGSEPVPGKSAYVQMILTALSNNEDQYVSARELYNRIFKGVMDQTKAEPTLKDLHVAGSEGGQFYFKKN